MRKYLIAIILALALPFAHGLLQPPTPVDASGDVVLATGTVTLANTKLSLADTYAFFDFNTDMTPWIGETIEICPATAASKHYCVRGLVSSVGTGETYLERVTGGNMETGDPPFFNKLATTVLDGVADERTGGSGIQSLDVIDPSNGNPRFYIPGAIVCSALYKYDIWSYVLTSGSTKIGFGSMGTYTLTSNTSWTNSTGFKVSAASCDSVLYFSLSTLGIHGRFDDVSVKQVLTPSTTGHWIKKSAASSTDGDGWSQKSASFLANDSAGYYYRIIKSKPMGNLTTSGTVTSSNVHLATVDAGAMVEISGVDLSAYAGGDDNASLPCRWINPHSTTAATWKTNRYLLALYDSSGKMATGYIGGPGAGIAVGSDVLSGWDFTSDWSGDACAATVSDTNTFAISAASGCVYKTYSALDTGTLYYATLVGTPSAGTLSLRGNSSEPIWCSGNTCTGYGTATTNTNDKVLVYNSSGGVGATADITSMTLQPVTDISTTGVHLHSTPNGYDRKMARKDSGFNPNGVTSYKIYQVGPSG